RTGLPSCVASVARRLGGERAFSERALALFTRSLGSIGFPQQAGKRLPPPVMAPPASVMASFASRQRLTHALLSARHPPARATPTRSSHTPALLQGGVPLPKTIATNGALRRQR